MARTTPVESQTTSARGVVGSLRERAERGVNGYLDQVLIDGPGREEHAHQKRPGQQVADPLGVEPAARLPCLPSFSSATLCFHPANPVRG